MNCWGGGEGSVQKASKRRGPRGHSVAARVAAVAAEVRQRADAARADVVSCTKLFVGLLLTVLE